LAGIPRKVTANVQQRPPRAPSLPARAAMSNLSFDYSKWNNICVSSDDDEDCHPNIEKYTWRRLRKQQREEERAKQDARTAELEALLAKKERRMQNLQNRLAKSEEGSKEREKIQDKIKLCEQESDGAKKEIALIAKQRKLTVDDLCLVTEERTVVTKGADTTKTSVSGDPAVAAAVAAARKAAGGEGEAADTAAAAAAALPQPEFAADAYVAYVNKYQPDIEAFVAMAEKDARDNNDFLQAHPWLLHEHTSGFLLLLALEREMQEPEADTAGMRRVVRQYLLLQTVLDLAKQTKKSPRDVLPTIMKRIHDGGEAQQKRFDAEVLDFSKKIAARAVAKKEEERKRAALRPDDAEEGYEYVEMSKEERMGPGGLDPVEVFASLPKAMQEAFEKKDIPMLQAAVAEMDPDEAMRHMERCEKSGLWNPGE
jgi:cell division cycle protein 37